MRALTDRQRLIAEENHGLVISFIRKNRLDFDEYYGDLAETYCFAVASYDESKGRLSTYVFVSLGNRLKNIYRSRSSARAIPEDMFVSMDGSYLADKIPAKNTSVEDEVSFKMAWEQICKEFSDFELEMLSNIIYRERSQREIAGTYGTSQSSYARWEKAVKNKARQILLDALV